jgi:integrase
MLIEIVRHRDMVHAGLEHEENIDRPIGEVFDEFLADVKARRSPSYFRRVSDILARLQRDLRFRTLRDIKPQVLMNYRAARVRQGAANRTANMEVRVLGTALGWAVRANLLPYNPVARVPLLPTGRAYEKCPRRPMSDEEIERFVAAAIEIDQEALERTRATKTIESGVRGPEYAAKPRLRPVPQAPLWIALVGLGARFGELTHATWSDLSETNATLTLRAPNTKTKRERVLPLRHEMLDVLRGLRVVHHERLGRLPGPGERIFLSPSGAPWTDNRSYVGKRCRAVLERAGIPRIDARGEKVDVHAMRVTCGTRMARHGVPLVQIQKMLGHSTPVLTAQVYTRLGAEDLRTALKAVPALRVAAE